MTTSFDTHTEHIGADSWFDRGTDAATPETATADTAVSTVNTPGPEKPRRSPRKGGRGRSAPAKQAEVDRTLVRRVISKIGEVSGATEQERQILSVILGCPNDTDRLVTEIICTRRVDTTAVHDLVNLSQEDPLEAGLTVTTWEGDKRADVWGLLVGVGAVDGNLSSNAQRAARSIASAALEMTEENKKLLLDAVALARK